MIIVEDYDTKEITDILQYDNEVEMVNDSTSTATVSEPEELKDLTVKGFM